MAVVGAVNHLAKHSGVYLCILDLSSHSTRTTTGTVHPQRIWNAPNGSVFVSRPTLSGLKMSGRPSAEKHKAQGPSQTRLRVTPPVPIVRILRERTAPTHLTPLCEGSFVNCATPDMASPFSIIASRCTPLPVRPSVMARKTFFVFLSLQRFSHLSDHRTTLETFLLSECFILGIFRPLHGYLIECL